MGLSHLIAAHLVLLVSYSSSNNAPAVYNPYPNNPFLNSGHVPKPPGPPSRVTGLPPGFPTQGSYRPPPPGPPSPPPSTVTGLPPGIPTQGSYRPTPPGPPSPLPPIYQPPPVTPGPVYPANLPVTAPTHPPPTDSPLRKYCLSPRGQFPGPSCNSFVNCWEDGVVEQLCSPTLVFNPAGYCDYPENVNCQGKPVQSAPPTGVSEDGSWKPESSGQWKPENAGQWVPDTAGQWKPENNGQWVPDTAGQWVPDGTGQWKPDNAGQWQPDPVTNPPAIAPTYHPTISPPVGPTQPPLTRPPITGGPVTLPQSDHPTLAPATPPTNAPVLPPIPQQPLEIVPAPVDPKLKQLCLKPRGQFPGTSCNSYVNCWDDIVIEQQCPPGLLFSDKLYCDYPYNVDCKNRTQQGRTSSPQCRTEYGTFRDSKDCNTYYSCSAGEVIGKFVCPQGLRYNELIGVCDYEENVPCGNATASNPVPAPGIQNILQKVHASLVDPLVGCLPGSVLRLNPECTLASLCRSGLVEIVHCPGGLSYDSKTDKCLPPHLAKC